VQVERAFFRRTEVDFFLRRRYYVVANRIGVRRDLHAVYGIISPPTLLDGVLGEIAQCMQVVADSDVLNRAPFCGPGPSFEAFHVACLNGVHEGVVAEELADGSETYATAIRCGGVLPALALFPS
jgi:hypothetical protein